MDFKLAEKQKQKDRQKAAVEQKSRKEAEEKARKDSEDKSRREVKEAKDFARKEAVERLRKEAEEKRLIQEAITRQLHEDLERKDAQIKFAAEEKVILEAQIKLATEEKLRMEAQHAEKQNSTRSLADEHSKKLKIRLESRAIKEQAQNARKVKDKKATKASVAMKSHIISSPPTMSLGLVEISSESPSLPNQQVQNMLGNPLYDTQSPEMTPSVRQFFHSTQQEVSSMNTFPSPHIPKQMHHESAYQQPVVTSKLGITLQPFEGGLPNLGDLWADRIGHSPSTPKLEISTQLNSPQMNHSPWLASTSSNFSRGGLNPGATFNPPHPADRPALDTSSIYDETGDFNLLKIQEEIRRTEASEDPRHFAPDLSRRLESNWPAGLARTLAPPPGFGGFQDPAQHPLWNTNAPLMGMNRPNGVTPQQQQYITARTNILSSQRPPNAFN